MQKVHTLSPPMHFFLNSLLQQLVFCLPLSLASVAASSCRRGRRRGALHRPFHRPRATSATLVRRCCHHIEVIIELLPRCSLAHSTSRLSSSWCKELRCVARRAILGVTVLLAVTCAVWRASRYSCATHRRPSSCFTLSPLSMSSYHAQLGVRGRSGATHRSSRRLGRVGVSERSGDT
jgi:hypothetical protein